MRVWGRLFVLCGVVGFLLAPVRPAGAINATGTVVFATVVGVGPPGVCDPGLGPVGPACVVGAPTPPQPYFLGPAVPCVGTGVLGLAPIVDPACGVVSGGVIGGVLPASCGLTVGDSAGPPADFIVLAGVAYPITYGWVSVGTHVVITGSVDVAGHAHPFNGYGAIVGFVGAAPPPAIPCVTTPLVAFDLVVTAEVSGL